MVRVNIEIDDDLIRIVRRLAVEKYGKLRGSLRAAFEEALHYWVKANSDAHTQIRASKFPAGPTGRRLRAILEEVYNIIGDSDDSVEVYKSFLVKIIQRHAGADWRTVSKYMKLIYQLYVAEPNGRKVLIYPSAIKEVLEA